MVRPYVTENREDGGLTIFMVGMIAASISMMAIVIFACAKSSKKRKNNMYSDRGDGNRTSAKTTVVISESNKAEKPRATSAPVHPAGEILVIAAETATTAVDIPSTDDVCNNNNDDGGKDIRCHDGESSKNNDVSNDRIDNNNSNMGASHTHVIANNTSGGNGHHHEHTSGNTAAGGGHHHDHTSGNTGGGGGWSSDHGGSSWSGGDHSGGGFSGGCDTGGFSSGGW